MRTIAELLFKRENAQAIRRAVQAEPSVPEPPATAPIEPARLELVRAEYRERGAKLFAVFDECQRRLIEAEVVMGAGRRNPEERHRLALTVRALREWMCTAKELGLLQEFSKQVGQFARYLQHEAREEALAAKAELPWRTRLFLESGEDVTAPASKPVQNLDYDPERCIHPRY